MNLRDELVKDIILALQKYKSDHKMGDKEISEFTSIMATVAFSTRDIRAIFYLGVADIATNIQKILKLQEESLLKEIAAKGKDDDDKILN